MNELIPKHGGFRQLRSFQTAQKGLRQWDKNSPEALKVRSDWSDEKLANTLICLTNQASYLLWKQIQRLEEDFKNEGGFTEKLYNYRKKSRGY